MADFGQYRGDVFALRRGADTLTSIKADFLAVQRDFQQEVAQYNGWYGIDDDFANSTGPQYEKNRESCLSALATTVKIVGGLIDANLEQIKAVEQPQSDALDDINSVGLPTDTGSGTDSGRR
ncbi:hypothetical protein [Streptomyces sp. NBC_00102]|uniref:hypothetical protein n=1 Tax=Streptomyces sp. NBC_00102 TaxID=2975652 RepID=UPI00224D347A|nr:hypothetical protein [Streptomyces sp. NBC_00102]MCX5400449.1 hypothetical protein [Streptomyces sp. NBC_00102]